MGHSHSARHGVRWSRSIPIAALLLATAGVQAEGLVLRAPDGSLSLHSPSEYALAHARIPTNSIRLFGDYYFFDPARSNMGPTLGSLVGGFRASTGVVGLSQPMSLFDARPDPLQNLPYIGLGYSHLYFNRQLSLNADFGLASQNASVLGHGHGFLSGTQSLDDVTRDLRWAPVMAVNVSYSF